MSTRDIAALTATELVAAYSSGELSPVEATTAALECIDTHDKQLNAYCHIDADGALEQARNSEQRWQQGNPLGLIDGVPTSIKDVFLTSGWPTRRGSAAMEPTAAPTEDSPAVARLREHGAVLLGKTTTPELGWKAVTDSPLTGVTRNPVLPELTSGGSSGGSAAAVAAGMGPLSLGTDGGGSVRIPASFCGIVGFKPTYGRIPLYPASPFGGLAHAGPMARSVDDVTLMLDVVSLGDHRDPTALLPPDSSYREAAQRDVSGLIAAFSPTLGYVDVDPEVEAIVKAAVHRLQDAGVNVELADPGFADPIDAFTTLWSAGAVQALRGYPAGSLDRADPGLVALAEHGAQLSAGDYLDAMQQRMSIGRTMGEFHQRYDVLITPTMPITAFAAGHDVPPGGPYPSWPSWTPFTYPFNLTQQPAASIPVGRTAAGAPVGLHVVGPRYSDDLVLAVCRQLESRVAVDGNR